MPYQIFYFDFSDWWKTDFDLSLYLRKLFTKDYYSNPGHLQWNYYLVFLYDLKNLESGNINTIIGEEDLRKIEKNEDFAKKFVINYNHLENWLEEKYKVNINEAAKISQDLSLSWIDKLRESDLDCVYSKDIDIQVGLDYYISGNPIKETNREEINLYQKSLRILEKYLGPDHLEVARTLNDIAAYYTQIGDYEKALPSYQRALDIREKVLGLQHPDIAKTLNNLALLYDKMGDYEKALQIYQRIEEGLNHPK